VLHSARLERLARDKHSSLLCTIICCKENKVLVNMAPVLAFSKIAYKLSEINLSVDGAKHKNGKGYLSQIFVITKLLLLRNLDPRS
jgi:hypothetical protein